MACGVVYYSYDGSTAVAARIIARQKGGSVYELLEKRPRKKSPGAFMAGAFQAVFKGKSKLQNDFAKETQAQDTLYIGSPVWGSSSVPAVNAFVSRADLKGKDIYLFFVCASPEPDYIPKGGVNYLSRLIARKGGRLKDIYVLLGAKPGETATEAQMAEQIGSKVK
jgi:flavodoxin